MFFCVRDGSEVPCTADSPTSFFGTRERPIIFYSNGYEHWMWDDASYPPRAVQGFFKKQELELLIQRRTSRKKLADAVINPAIIDASGRVRSLADLLK